MCEARYRIRTLPKDVAAGPLMYEVRRTPSCSALVLAPREDRVIEGDKRREE